MKFTSLHYIPVINHYAGASNFTIYTYDAAKYFATKEITLNSRQEYVRNVLLPLCFLPLLCPQVKADDIFSLIEKVSNIYNQVDQKNSEYIKSAEYLNSDYYRYLKWIHKDKPRIEKQTRDSLREYYSACAGCPEVLPLSEAVNDIVKELAKQEDQENPQAHLAEKIGSLEMIFNITKDLSQPLKGGGCYTETYCGNNKYESIIDNSTILVFSSPIDQNRLRGITFKNDSKTEYYYRASLDNYSDEIIIHLIIDEQGQPFIEYYSQLEHVPVKDPLENAPIANSGQQRPNIDRPKNVYGPWLGFRLDDKANLNQEDENYIQGHLALAVKLPSGGGIPERIHVAGLDAKFGDTTANFEVSSDKTSLMFNKQITENMNLVTGANTNYSSITALFAIPQIFTLEATSDMNLEAVTAKLKIPTKISTGGINLEGSTSISHQIGDQNVDVETNYVVRLDSAPNITLQAKSNSTIGYNPENNDTDIILNQLDFAGTMQLDPYSSISLIFDYQYQENPTLTLSYTLNK